MSQPLHILKTVYGYEAFRGRQEEVISHVLAGRNAFVLMPTGGGKSLCYQIPGLCRPGLGIVVSPLIALMADQVAALRQAGVRAAVMNSTQAFQERADVWRAIGDGALDLLYVAPETLLKPETLERLSQIRLSLIAIDEAHCLSQWGHDFRPEYRRLDCLVSHFPDTPRIALTATADAPTRGEILEHLRISAEDSFVAGFDRPNIRYAIAEKDSPRKQMLSFLERFKGESGIIYCLRKRTTEEIAAFLNERGFTALAYHAGLDKAVREANQTRFQREEGLIIVATTAFGMGIDKPDVRFVLHLDLPGSIEAYYQETGRAGRDGLPAEALLLYGYDDIALRRRFIDESEAPEQRKRMERQKLDALLGLTETGRCRREMLLDYFGDAHARCGNCDNCEAPPALFDATVSALKALSCIYRTGERFGQAYIVSVLLGAEDERIARFGHDRISTYGIGSEHDARQWRSILRQLVAHGLVSVDLAGHGGLSISQKGRDFLREKPQLMLRGPKQRQRKDKSAAARAASGAVPAEAQALFEALREKRLELARAQGVPPYVIFHDKTLAEIAAARPADRQALSAISGIGAAKLERYGDVFLNVVAHHEGARS
ncbi:DNA helicase RecQ [Nitratireductor sp. GCM10026969]|uniref:DNA helicase RecQ n=1 Tax=Nitratireductor sp. GCM10026969 TaxID=3252645 RepID=UPI00361560A0